MPVIPIAMWYILAGGGTIIGGGLASAFAFDKAGDASDKLLPVVAVGAMGAIAVMALRASKK